tara:strand:- start:223 stop:972 length:750 start_codon:yes stop_codon:yes gene_type:complete
MPSIPDIQTLTNQNVRQELAQGGFARTNLFQVYITNGWGTKGTITPFLQHLNDGDLKPIYGFDWNSTFRRKLAFSCSDATLPASSFATGEVKDNFMGVPQEFAHTRISPDIDFSFYVDRNYTILTFFEAWMDYVAGGNSTRTDPDEINTYSEPAGSYYRRFNYPNYYKNKSGFYITKFERNYKTYGATSINYQLVNAFPKTVTSIPVAYGEAEIMKVSVTMNYDRYRIYRRNETSFGTIDDPVTILPVL